MFDDKAEEDVTRVAVADPPGGPVGEGCVQNLVSHHFCGFSSFPQRDFPLPGDELLVQGQVVWEAGRVREKHAERYLPLVRGGIEKCQVLQFRLLRQDPLCPQPGKDQGREYFRDGGNIEDR